MKRWMRIPLALALLALLTAGAWAGGAKEQPAPAAAGHTMNKDPVTVKWFGTRMKPNPDAPVVKLLQEKLTQALGYPVKFDLLGVILDAAAQQQLTVMYAANDMPDVFLKSSLADDTFNKGAVTHIAQDDLKTYMPRSYQFLSELMTKNGLDPAATWGQYKDEQGKLIGAPRIWDMGAVPSAVVWRQDILDDLGIKAVPTTLAEAEAAFAAYKAKNPTKYPYGTYFQTGVMWQAANVCFNAYGLDRRGTWVTGPNGNLIRGYWHPDMKKALAVAQRWYKLGFIDPESINLKNVDAYDRFKQGQYLMCEPLGRIDYSGAPGSRIEILLKTVPGAKVSLGPFLKSETGAKPTMWVWNPFLTQYIGFGKHLEKDAVKLHKIMQVGDMISNDMDTKFLAAYGVAGKHYDLSDGGVAVWKPEYASRTAVDVGATEGYGFYWDGLFSTPTIDHKMVKTAVAKHVEDSNGLYGLNNLGRIFSPGPVWKTIVDEAGNNVSTPLQADTTITPDSVILKIIVGGEPVEYFDQMYQRYLKAGGDKEELYANKNFGPKK